MNKVDGYIKNYIIYYTNELALKINRMLPKEKISSEQEAKDLLSFIEFM